MSDVTAILSQIEQGDAHAAEQLLPLVYNELRAIAAQKMAQEKPGQTLQATALVHEAYLRLVGPLASGGPGTSPQCGSPLGDGEGNASRSSEWNSRGHFFAAAAEAMRRILVEQARRKKSVKGGGEWHRVELRDDRLAAPGENVDLIALDDALARLADLDDRKAELVKLRFFAGLTLREAAAALGIAESTADADWAYAKSWLRLELADTPDAWP